MATEKAKNPALLFETKIQLRENQLQELEVIKSIYGSDVEDLRPFNKRTMTLSQWKGFDIRISLTPMRENSRADNTEIYVRTKLHIVAVAKYPKIPPKIYLEESKGLSDQLIEELLQKLKSQAEELCGEVMIFELAQTVCDFLGKNNKPPPKSFYDEMLQEREKREKELLDLQQQKESQERQTLRNEVEKRKELFMTETKRRGEPRRSMSESNRHGSSSESSETSSPYYRSHIYPTNCTAHRNSETIFFHRLGRQVRRGCCLGHSTKGCTAYTGIDIDTGQLLYVTEWHVKLAHMQASCNNGGKCIWFPNEAKCEGNHRMEDLMLAIEKQVSTIAQLRHKNLVQYECGLCQKRTKDSFSIYLVQDFVLGTSVFSISAILGWCMDGARMVARGVLNALVFLHNKGVSHSQLLDTTVFMDNTGQIRCTDFALVPIFLELIGDPSAQRTSCGDLPALGALVEGLMGTHSFEMKDFIDKCNSDRTLSASELLDHPFLRTSYFKDNDDIESLAGALMPMNATSNLPHTQRKPSMGVALAARTRHDSFALAPQDTQPTLTIPSLPPSQSRLRIEFQVLMYLGKGAFGDVLKARNILDNREYAIKRIPLPARSKQLYKKMTREVELLSRLNHENVVRYFNSWIESVDPEDLEEMEHLNPGDWSTSRDSRDKPPKSPQCAQASQEETEESSSNLWNGYVQNMDDSDSDDGIEFVDSDGKVVEYEDDDDDESKNAKGDFSTPQRKSETPKPLLQMMYIQMEFCEKFTLRTAIDENLYENTERLWRFFREIAEGLSHIHQQGIIHRDLKPVNIFLDSHDQIKIGDFGLATTSFLALQSHSEHTTNQSMVVSTEDATGTGKVGTTLYVAPELTGNASKSTYSQKVDMYTLGIILFEMCQPPFGTGMERAQTMLALRSPAIVIPDTMLNDAKYNKTVQILRWLLNHDPSQRPTAEELLASDLVPPAQLEANELQEMLRHALDNPQSKAYKHLVARCLQQESDEILEHTYHLGSSRTMKSWNSPITLENLVSLNPAMEFVKNKVISLFRKHGGIEVDTPLLSPLSKHTNLWNNPVRLMTHSGCVVVLPCDLRTQFANHIAMSGVNMLRRYCVDRVYREEKVFNFHPKQNYECAFDIITPTGGGHLVDAELLSLAFEITRETKLQEKNLNLRMNHTSLLRAILIYCNVPKSMYSDLFGSTLDFIEGRISKFQFHSSIIAIMEKTKTSASTLMELLLSSFLLSGTRSSVDESALRVILRGKGEATSLAKVALRELESVVSLAQSLGVTCPIYIYPGLPISFDRATSGGIVWQLVADLKPNRSSRPAVLAVGERYDTLLHEFQKKAQSYNTNLTNRFVSGAGLSFSLDKLVAAFSAENIKDSRAIDVAICVSGTRPPLKDVTYIMRLLWSAGIRCGLIECAGACGDEAQDLAKLGALHIILVTENGALRVRTWERDRFHDKHVTRTELVEFIQKYLRNDSNHVLSPDYMSQNSNSNFDNWRGEIASSSSASNISKNYYSASQLPNVDVVFLTHEKLTANYRRRCENQVTQQMYTTLLQFSKKENFIVLVVELPPFVINAMVGAINPRGIVKRETEQELNIVAERYPKHKRYMMEIFNEIVDYLTDTKALIVALYSISDSYYRVII